MMKGFHYHRALRCLIVSAAALSSAGAKTLLLLPIKIDSTQIKDYRAIREFYGDALSNLYSGTVKVSKGDCMEKDCALDAAKAQGADEVVYGSVRTLGSKYFFNSSIEGEGRPAFSQQIGASSVEDFENATKRMAEALIKRQSLDQVVNVDNITEQEENQEINRRSQFYSTGASLGYLVPVGKSFQRWKTSSGCDIDPITCADVPTLQKYSQVFKLGWNNWFEFKNNLAMELDVLWFAPIAFGADANMDYLFGKGDFTPFAGGGLGIHYVMADEGAGHKDDDKRNSGPALNAQAGMILFRTYNINLVVRGQYHVIFNDDMDQGPSVDVALRTKMGGTGDKYHRVSATTWLGVAIGIAYVVALLTSAANN